MECPQCRRTLWCRKDWFKPQWQAHLPVVLDHEGGDFDRCKGCYYGASIVTFSQADRRFDDSARKLGAHMCGLACKVHVLRDFMCAVLSNSRFLAMYKNKGAVTCVLESDPKQYMTRDGRYTFDPRNRNYQKTWWLAWSCAQFHDTDSYNMVTLGDAVEAVLGVREEAVMHQAQLQQHLVVKSVCDVLSSFCNSVYNFTGYTGAELMPRTEWLAYVKSLRNYVD